jgi:HSP20 family molecular chaperone IbpA
MMLTKWQPFSALREVQNPIGTTLANTFSSLLSDFESPLIGFWNRPFPAVEVREDDNHYYIFAELPGIAVEAVEVTLEGDTLTISGERKADVADGQTVTFSERPTGSFVRRLTLPNLSAGEVVEARMDNGLLKITVRKSDADKRKRISVKAH